MLIFCALSQNKHKLKLLKATVMKIRDKSKTIEGTDREYKSRVRSSQEIGRLEVMLTHIISIIIIQLWSTLLDLGRFCLCLFT